MASQQKLTIISSTDEFHEQINLHNEKLERNELNGPNSKLIFIMTRGDLETYGIRKNELLHVKHASSRGSGFDATFFVCINEKPHLEFMAQLVGKYRQFNYTRIVYTRNTKNSNIASLVFANMQTRLDELDLLRQNIEEYEN